MIDLWLVLCYNLVMTKPIRTHWHQLLGKLFELVLTSLGIEVHVDFNVMSKPPRADLLMLRRDPAQLVWTLEQLARLPDGIRDSLASHILIELKYTEPVTADVLEKVHGYDIFYRLTHELKKEEVATFILSSHTTKKELLAEYGYQEVTELPGVYRSRYPMVNRVVVILLNELRDVPHNAFVKCFASRPIEKKKAFQALAKMGWLILTNSLWMFLAGLRRAMLGKGDEEMKVITPDDVMALGKRMQEALLESMTTEEILSRFTTNEILSRYAPEEVLSQYTPKEVLSQFTSKEVLSQFTPKEVLSQFTPKEVLSQFTPEEVLSWYKPEEVLSRYKLQLSQREQQAKCQEVLKVLIRTLQLRFQVAPSYFDNRLQDLSLEILEQLNEVAVTANTMPEFEARLNELTAVAQRNSEKITT